MCIKSLIEENENSKKYNIYSILNYFEDDLCVCQKCKKQCLKSTLVKYRKYENYNLYYQSCC